MSRPGMISACVVAAVCSCTFADSIDVRWLGSVPPNKPGIGRGRNLTFKLHNSAVTRWTGQYVVDMSNPTGPLASTYVGLFNVFCIDLSQDLSSNTRRYDVSPVNSIPLASGGGALAIVRANSIKDIFAGSGGAALNSAASDDLAAAFAIAIWEIVYDYNPTQPGKNLDLFGGAFTFVHPDALSDSIEAIVANIFAAIGTNMNPPIAGFSSANHQDFVTCGDGGCTIIPLPSTAGLGAIGLALVGSRRRRR